jgi:hypothetical protein
MLGGVPGQGCGRPNTLMDSGAVGPDGTLDPTAHSFTNRLVNVRGTLNDLHQVWDTRVIAYNNTIQSGRSQIVRYEFKVPENATGPITITAKVNYRRFNQHFHRLWHGQALRHAGGGDSIAHADTAMGSNPAAPPDPADNPEWMRWNNYGIGLLDAQQYAESARAFEQVASCGPIMPTPTPMWRSPTFRGSATTGRAPIWRRRCNLLRTMPARFTILRWSSAFRAIPTLPSPICST